MAEITVFASIASLPLRESIEAAYQLSRILDERSLLASLSEEEILDRAGAGSTIDASGRLRPLIAKSIQAIESTEKGFLNTVSPEKISKYIHALDDLVSAQADSILADAKGMTATKLAGAEVNNAESVLLPRIDKRSMDDVVSLAYEDLRAMASNIRRRDPAATIGSTALVHEAWSKLRSSPQLAGVPFAQFKAIAAKAMRQVLVDAARMRTAQKRGGGREQIALADLPDTVNIPSEELIALNEALETLSHLNPRQARMVEFRFFAGLSVVETAELMGVSSSVVERDWRAAKAWLATHIRRQGVEGSLKLERPRLKVVSVDEGRSQSAESGESRMRKLQFEWDAQVAVRVMEASSSLQRRKKLAYS